MPANHLYSKEFQKNFRQSLLNNRNQQSANLQTIVETLDKTAKQSRGRLQVFGHFAGTEAGVDVRLKTTGQDSIGLMSLRYDLTTGRASWFVVDNADK